MKIKIILRMGGEMIKGIHKAMSIIFVFFVVIFSYVNVYADQSRDTFLFVSITPLSGGGAPWGLAEKRALEYVANDWNAKGGLNVKGKNYTVKVKCYDNKYSTTETVNALNKAIYEDKVKFLSVLGGANVLAAVKKTESNNIFMFANAAGMEQITNPTHPLTFRAMINSDVLGSALYYDEIIKQYNIKRIALIYPNDETGYMAAETCKKTIKLNKLQLDVVGAESINRGQLDYLSVIMKVVSMKPDIIDFTSTSPGDMARLLKQLGESGYKGLTMNSVSVQSADVLWETAKDYAKGHFMVGVFAEPPTNDYEQFTQRFLKDSGGKSVNPVAYYMYASFDALLSTIQKEQSFDTKLVANALASKKWNSLYGPSMWAGKEDVFGFGINRTLSVPVPMSRIGNGGKVEKWRLKSIK